MKKGLIIGIIAVAAGCAVALDVHHQMRRTAQMRAALVALQAANQADSVFTTDSLALELVRYFDHPLRFWTSANDRLMAHYLLGRCYADMGEAPRAIEEYSEAVEKADTTASDCDLRTLRAVYGQMANVFHQQNLPQEEMEAEQRFIHFSYKMGDSLMMAIGIENLTRAYYLIGDSDAILRYSRSASDIFYSIGRNDLAANALNTSAFIETQRGNAAESRWLIDLIRRESSFFDSSGNLQPGREMFYYTLGLYFENTHQLDSAEYYYRRLLLAQEYEASYRGLLSLFEKQKNADSIVKYVRLYADANDAYHDGMRTDAVILAAKNFKYTRYQQRAKEQEAKAKRRAYYIIVLSLVIFCLATFIFFQVQQGKKRKITLALIKEQYQQAKEDFRTLQEDKSLLEIKYQNIKGQTSYYSSEIVNKVTDSVFGISQEASSKDLNKLYDLFITTFEDFRIFAESKGGLTEHEWDVCIYVDLGFRDKEIALLMGLKPQRIYSLKLQLNKKLFHEETVITFAKNLRKVLHSAKES